MSYEVAAPTRTEHRNRFFHGMAIFVLVYVVIAFTPTFFLRPLFHSVFYVPAVPWYYFLHGVLMTAWVVLFLVQTSLVAAYRIDLHRRLGVSGAVLAVAVTASMIIATLGLPEQFKMNPVRNGGQVTSFQAMVQLTWINLAELAVFPAFIAAAIGMRRHPDAHKRLLLLGLMSLLGPAAGRIAPEFAVWGSKGSAPLLGNVLGILAGVAGLLLPLTLIAHDLRSMRRLHAVTLWGVSGLFMIGFALPLVVANTNVGRTLIAALE